ncbi:MAG TPA: MoxR family ATPase [Planctomycetota bacterium]|jgi:MoxR-like ATPase|nr:MoxR family ATPase [Planctomycetota bacterium]
MTDPTPGPDDLQTVERLRAAYATMKKELRRTLVGLDPTIDELFLALFSRGHTLLVGVPGLAKTLLVSSVARILNLSFNRIQFTPDLMPSDITGTEVLQEDRTSGTRTFRFLPGPIFANVILADEVNRTPPKTQAALLEAMQETQVTAAGKKHVLEKPFFVLATQNPIEQEGTYPLPEAQLDRFMFMVRVDYPSLEEEREIVRLTTQAPLPELQPVLSGPEILALQEMVRRVPIADHVLDYALALVRRTRPPDPDAPTYVRDWVTWGAGPRASQFLVLGGKARAVLSGRPYVAIEDVVSVAKPVLRHRIVPNFSAQAEGISTDQIVERLLGDLPRHASEAVDRSSLGSLVRR